MEIILVRHGLSEANKTHTIGSSSTPLAKEGYEQAAALAERLKGLEIDAVYTSTMRRAIDTARPFSEKAGAKIIADERIGEANFGRLEGKSDAEAEEIIGHSIRDLFDSYEYDLSRWGGETSDEVRDRVQAFLNDLKKQPYKLVLIVCHGGIVRWMHYLITGEKISWQPNAEELRLKT